MVSDIKRLLIGTVVCSLVMLGFGALFAWVLGYGIFDILLAGAIGWVTGTVNFGLLFLFGKWIFKKGKRALAVIILILRYVIYGVSLYLTVGDLTHGVAWAIGFVLVIFSAAINYVIQINKEEGGKS